MLRPIAQCLTLLALFAVRPAFAHVLSLEVLPEGGTCPSRTAVVAELQRILPEVRFDDAGTAARVEDLGDRFLVWAGGGKTLADPDFRCGERARSAALVIAVELDQSTAIAPPEPEAPPSPTVVAPVPANPRPTAQLIFGFGLGTAQAIAPAGSETEVAWQLRSDASGATYQRAAVGEVGLLLAPLHLRADVGVRLRDRWELIASLRAQILVGDLAHTVSTQSGAPPIGGTDAAKGAFAGLFRARRRFPVGPIAPFVELAIGVGQVRPTLDLSGAQTAGQPLVDEITARAYNMSPSAQLDRQLVCASSSSCSDTILLGYALIGGGAGIQIRLVEGQRAALSLTASTTFLGAFGGAQRGLVVDWDLGLLARAF